MISTMGTPVPFITLAELKRSPIYGQLQQLVPHSSPLDRDAELLAIVTRVSAMVNGEVNQNLAATVDREIGRAYVSYEGDLIINCNSNPIIEVQSLAVGHHPSQLTPITDLTGIITGPWQITLPQYAGYGWYGYSGYGHGGYGNRLWARWTYVNGYPVTTLAEPAEAGATSITVADGTGIVADATILTVTDGKWAERVMPTAVTGNVLTVPALAYPHEVGVGATELPGDVVEAMLLLISRLHDTWSLSMGAITADGSGAKIPGATVKRAMCDAAVILSPYRQFFVR